MDKKYLEQSLKIERTLIEIEQGRTSAPYIPAMCAAFVLYIAHNTPQEVELKGILSANKISDELARFVVSSIGDHWSDYQPLLTAFEQSDLADLFATTVSGVRMFELYGRGYGECGTPQSVVELAIEVLSVHKDDTVTDICSGAGDFIRAAYFRAFNDADSNYMVGYERNVQMAAFSQIRMLVDDARVTIKAGDCFHVKHGCEKFTKVFAQPPFLMRGMANDSDVVDFISTELPDFPRLATSTMGDWLFAARAVAAMAKGGRAAVIVSPSVMFDSRHEAYRRYFLQRNLIEAVIELPPRLFMGTNIPAYMLVISEGNDQIKMIRASGLCNNDRHGSSFSHDHIRIICEALGRMQLSNNTDLRNILVTAAKEDLIADNCDLTVSKHFADPAAIKDGVQLGSLVAAAKRGAAISADELASLSTDEETPYRYVSLGDINDGVINAKLINLREMPEKYLPYCVKNGDIIITRVMSSGADFKVAVVDEKPGVILLPNGNLLVVTVDTETADPYFIKACLDNDYAQRYLQACSSGAAVKMLSYKSLDSLPIPKVSIERQHEIGNSCREAVQQVLESRARLVAARESLGNVFNEKASDCLNAKEGR